MTMQSVSSGSHVFSSWRPLKRNAVSTSRLRYQLAEDGCAESQVALAKSFLTERTDSDEERSVNTELAVYWLVLAARSGNNEAISLLSQCYKRATGITDNNRKTVETCLNFSETEKLAYRIGHYIYRSIAYDMDESIPVEMFQERTMLLLSETEKTSGTKEQSASVSSNSSQKEDKVDSSDFPLWAMRPTKESDNSTRTESKAPPSQPAFKDTGLSSDYPFFVPVGEKENGVKAKLVTFADDKEKDISPKIKSQATDKVQIPMKMKPTTVVQSTNSEKESSTKAKIQEVSSDPVNQSSTKEVNDTCTDKPKLKRLTSADIVASVKQCFEGELPLVALKDTFVEHSSNIWITAMDIIKYPWALFLTSSEIFIEGFASALPLVTMMTVFFVYWIMPTFISPSWSVFSHFKNYEIFAICVCCMIAMVSSTCYVIMLSAGFSSMCRWLELVKHFEPATETADIKRKYENKKTLPLLLFLAVTFLFVIIYPSNARVVKDVLILSAFLMVWTNNCITKNTRLVKASLFINAILFLYKVKLIHFVTFGWFSLLDLGFCFQLGNFDIQVSTFTLLAVLLVPIYVKMALAESKEGLKNTLLPHLMSLVWLNLAFMHLKDYNLMDSLGSMSFWLVILLISRVTGSFLSVLLVSFARYYIYAAVDIPLSIIAMFMIVVGISMCCSSYLYHAFKLASRYKISALLGVAGAILLLYFQTFWSSTSLTYVLPWDQYQMQCHRPAWDASNMAEVQIACLPLQHSKVAVEGTVTSINVVAVENYFQSFTNILPFVFSEWVKCAFGHEFSNCSEPLLTSVQRQRCLLYQAAGIGECHLQQWNKYKFEVVLEIAARFSPEVRVIVNHNCLGFILQLKEGDTVHVIGTLDSHIGGVQPVIHFHSAECISCYEEITCAPHASTYAYDADWTRSVHYFTSFYLSPMITYLQTSEETKVM